MTTHLAIDAGTGRVWYRVDGGVWKPFSTHTAFPVSATGQSTPITPSTWSNVLQNYSFTGVTSPEETKKVVPELEVVQGDMPILAHRAALIALDRKGLHLASLNFSAPRIDQDMDAICRKACSYYDPWAVNAAHKAPDPDCQCGFYAVPADVDAWHSMGTVDLLVELSGTVIEHDRGYRAEHQRVIQMYVPRCPICREPSEFVYLMDNASQRWFCAEHMGKPKLNHNRHLIDREMLAHAMPWLSIADEEE